MAFSIDEQWVYNGQHVVAKPFTTPKVLGVGAEKIKWSSYIQGSLQVGAVDDFGAGDYPGTATVMIGRTDTKPTPRALNTRGNVHVEGDSGTPWAVNVKGNQEILGNGQTANGLYVTGGSSDNALYVEGDLYVSGKIDGDNKGRLASRFGEADLKGKVFDMPHPTKGKGHRLSHACIEGPEIGVYFRGRCKNEKVIKIPDYWKGLVHTDSISVQLQPVGSHQDIIVKRWDDDFIYLQANGGLPINCFYHVYGERKDINPLYVEYEGDEFWDYPDPNHTKPKDDPTRNLSDPQYRGRRNTYTV